MMRLLDVLAAISMPLAGTAQMLLAQGASTTDTLVGALVNAGGLGLFSGAVFWLLRDHMTRTAQQFDMITSRLAAEMAADRALREAGLREIMAALRTDHQQCRVEHCAMSQRIEIVEQMQRELIDLVNNHVKGD